MTLLWSLGLSKSSEPTKYRDGLGVLESFLPKIVIISEIIHIKISSATRKTTAAKTTATYNRLSN